ncbi:MAG: type III secretion system export apparatus subunit SctV [Deltaproteobacteria bacterium]|jgi:type III secretion protein V|nr:type III secretion system export apparatus subunit SctV [Deltaproteobacteria bacterium]
MNKHLQSLEALPVAQIGRHPDLILAIGVSAIVAMLIMPLPMPLVDVLLALNLALAAVILVASLMSDKPLAISTFPTLLLITTLFRLALNVSTTRSILTKASGGEVVRAFGEFVLKGDVVVGMVIFLVITLVQFMVIAKGAERVAEVGARFTLDAMPGKQMSIDAAVRSGSITEEEGQLRRDELGRESQFHGAMDGAMKFIKGDAIAGLIICAINLIAGFAIGVLRNGMDGATAAQTYSVLTVGDGLVSQIPALLVTLASGVLTTRVAGAAKVKGGLAGSLQSELFANPKVLFVGAGLALALAVVPGFPTVPFLVIGLSLAGLGATKHAAARKIERETQESQAQTFQKSLDQKVQQAKAQRAHVDHLAPTVVPIAIDLDPVLSERLGFGQQGDDETELLGVYLPQIRDSIFLETGVRIPGVRVRSNVKSLEPGAFVIRINEVPLAKDVVPLEGLIALESPDRLRRLGLDAQATFHPITGGVASIVPAEQAQALKDAGIPVRNLSAVVACAAARLLRRNVKLFVGLQETSESLERLQKVCGTLVKEVVPRIIGVAQLADILKRLVDEDVSIRDLKSILEALAVYGPHETNPVQLTELIRGALAQQIAHSFAGMGGRLGVVLLDDVLEDSIRGAICHSPGGSYLALEPQLRVAAIQAIAKTLSPVVQAGTRPVILTNADVRRYVRKLVEEDLVDVSVLSYQELPSQVVIQALGRVSLGEGMLAA